MRSIFHRRTLFLTLSAAIGALLIIPLLRSAGAADVMPYPAAAGTPGFLPLLQRPDITPSPTPTPAPPPEAVTAVPYACCFDTSAVTDIEHAGDERLFVLEREGVIRVIQPGGVLQPEPFLDISDQVALTSWDQGLLGIAFHPNYMQNGTFYVAVTPAGEITLALFRFSRSLSDPDVADPASGVRLLTVPKPSSVHNGGDLSFGPDGYLYLAVGDGGPDRVDPDAGPGDPNNNGQRLDEALGNILRIDVDSSGGTPPDNCANGSGYTVPADNPFVDGSGGKCDEVWAYGLRNPWRFSFDRVTGDLYIGDVGEFEREEINFAPAGAGAGLNFGWHCYEGSLDYRLIWPGVAPDCGGTGYTFPVLERPHTALACSLIGGFVYRGLELEGLYGRYLFGDYCGRDVRFTSAAGWQDSLLLQTTVFLSTFGEDVHGEIYFGGWGEENIWKLVPAE